MKAPKKNSNRSISDRIRSAAKGSTERELRELRACGLKSAQDVSDQIHAVLTIDDVDTITLASLRLKGAAQLLRFYFQNEGADGFEASRELIEGLLDCCVNRIDESIKTIDTCLHEAANAEETERKAVQR